MKKKFAPLAPALTPEKQLSTLIENRSVHTLSHCELTVFETYKPSQQVSLRFDGLVFTAMLRGKKVMHLLGKPGFEYLPGESVIVPQNEEMLIDFPEASAQQPAQCLALTIDNDKIRETLTLLNEQFPKAEAHQSWHLDMSQLHIRNSVEITGTVNKLLSVSSETHRAKDVLANLALQELLIRLMQTQARTLIFEHHLRYLHTHRFALVVNYIHEHLTEHLSIQRLSDLACMSQPHFFRSFKREFGISPLEFITEERLKLAKKYLSNPLLSIADAAFRAGFHSLSYFATLFKKHEGATPGHYRQAFLQKKA